MVKILNYFIENYLINTLISLLLSGAMFIYIKNESINIEVIVFTVITFITSFLAMRFMRYIYNKMSKHFAYKKWLKIENEKNIDFEIKQLRKLWDIIDSLPINEYDYLKTLISNGNVPIYRYGNYHMTSYNNIFDREWVVETYLLDGNKVFKLKEDVYLLLKYSMDKYGKIGNFENK